MVGLVRVVPIVVFSMISGVVADAWDRRQADAVHADRGDGGRRRARAARRFAALTPVWPLYVLAALGSAVGAFDLPARGALVPTLVPREHLPNAISLNTIMFQTASVVGPSLGGLLIASTGVGWVYVANAISFALRDRRAADDARRAGAPEVGSRHRATTCRCTRRSKGCASSSARRSSARRCCSISSRRSSRRRRRCCRSSRRTSCRSAPRATAGSTRRRRSARWPTSAVMVPLTERIERRGPTLLWAVARLRPRRRSCSASRASFWLTFACLALTGATDTVSMVIRNVVRQLETPDRLRGRMTGVNMVFFMGGPQLGELEAGAVANWLGAPFSVDHRRHRLPARDRLGRGDDAGAAAVIGARDLFHRVLNTKATAEYFSPERASLVPQGFHGIHARRATGGHSSRLRRRPPPR